MQANYILLFRCVLFLTLLLQSVYAPGAEERLLWVGLCNFLYGGFALGWYWGQTRGGFTARTVQWSFLIDLAAASAVLYLNPSNSSEYHIAFFLVVLTSAFLQKPPFSFLLAGAACLIYGGMSLAETGTLLAPEPLLRLVLLMVMAFFSTSMVETARRAKQAEQKRLETRIEWMERLSKIGQALQGVLHEVKTPLGTISLTSEFIREALKRGEDIDEPLNVIRQEAERATDILLNFLEYTRPTDLELTPLDLNEALEDALFAMRIRMEDSEIERDGVLLPAAPIEGSRRHLVQMFQNLLMNAIKAMPLGGKLKVEQEIAGERVLTRIQDDGTGISAEDLAVVFEPYHTSRTTSESYGLGLGISKWIVEKHGGELRLDSPGLGRGATVTVELPLADDR